MFFIKKLHDQKNTQQDGKYHRSHPEQLFCPAELKECGNK